MEKNIDVPYTGMGFYCAEVIALEKRELEGMTIEPGDRVTISHPYQIHKIREKFPEYDPNINCILWAGGSWVDEQQHYAVDKPVRIIKGMIERI